MSDNEGPRDSDPTIPPGSPVVKQSNWAWIWSLLPWFILAIIQSFVDPTFIILSIVLAAVTTGPRYLRWKRSAYILTDEHVIIQQGTMSAYRRYPVPIASITEMRIRPGYFGNSLGYRTVELTLGEQGKVLLDAVPAESRLIEHIKQRLRPPGRQ